MIRPVLLASALALACAACTTPSQQSETASTAEAPWGASPPLDWSDVGGGVEAYVGIDTAARPHRVLHAVLLAEASADMSAWALEMRTARAEFVGPSSSVPWTGQMVYDEPVQTERLLGLWGLRWTFEGGAHGNGVTTTVLWDTRAATLVKPEDLLKADVDVAALDAVLCRHLNAVRDARTAEWEGDKPEPLPLPGARRDDEGLWSCPRALETAFLPAPGDQPGRAGGLKFRIDPYVAGPYAEGRYEVVIPQDEIRALLSPEWADQFAGRPLPLSASGD